MSKSTYKSPINKNFVGGGGFSKFLNSRQTSGRVRDNLAIDSDKSIVKDFRFRTVDNTRTRQTSGRQIRTTKFTRPNDLKLDDCFAESNTNSAISRKRTSKASSIFNSPTKKRDAAKMMNSHKLNKIGNKSYNHNDANKDTLGDTHPGFKFFGIDNIDETFESGQSFVPRSNGQYKNLFDKKTRRKTEIFVEGNFGISKFNAKHSNGNKTPNVESTSKQKYELKNQFIVKKKAKF